MLSACGNLRTEDRGDTHLQYTESSCSLFRLYYSCNVAVRSQKISQSPSKDSQQLGTLCTMKPNSKVLSSGPNQFTPEHSWTTHLENDDPEPTRPTQPPDLEQVSDTGEQRLHNQCKTDPKPNHVPPSEDQIAEP